MDDSVVTASDLPRSEEYRQQRAHTSIELRVLEKLATEAALSVPGVIRHSAAISQITGRRFPRVSVTMESGDRAAVIDVQVATAWPAPTVAVAQVTRETVAEWIEHSTGVPVLAVNVDVGAVVPVDGPALTVGEVTAAHRTPALAHPAATPLTATSPVVNRTVPVPSTPPTPERAPVVHPAPVVSVPVREVVAHRPEPARPAIPPDRRPVHVPSTPATVQLKPVFLATGPDVLHPVVPPGSPITRLVDTPRGLPTRTVPTPEGLELTIFPRVRNARRIPVTVDRSRRWNGGRKRST